MYREYFFVLFSYWHTLSKKEFLYEILIPIIIFVFMLFAPVPFNKESILQTTLTFISIILGFTIASITIILTSNSTNFDKAKKEKTDRNFRGINTLYQLLLVPFFYIAIFSFFELIFGAITILFKLDSNYLIYCLNFLFIFHILLVAIRNITNLFFIVIPKN
jgi:hypothetical protein